MAKSLSSDSELVRRLSAGDQSAFATLVERHQGIVTGVALSILNDVSASEDAAQETFLTAWKKIGNLRDASKLRSWLAAIARNKALHHLRMKKKKPTSETPDETLSDGAATPDQVATHKDDLSLVLGTLETLPEKYRTPLILFYREDQSVATVAETLGLSPDAVKQRLKRGRDQLRDQVENTLAKALQRSAPTATFTATVVTAFSLLNTPTASAAAGLSLSSVTTSASATSSKVTTGAMIQSSKLSLPLAALIGVAAIPAGYGLRQVFTTKEAATPLVSTSSSTRSSPRSTIMVIPPSEVVEEWKRLQETFGTGPEALPKIQQSIDARADGFLKEGLAATLLAHWVEEDPQSGYQFFKAKKNDVLITSFIKEWLRHDSTGAVEGIQLLDQTWGQQLGSTGILLAQKEPEFFMTHFGEIRLFHSGTMERALRILADHDHLALRDAAVQAQPQGWAGHLDPALNLALQRWALEDGPKAFQWALAYDGKGAERARAGALAGWASIEPRAALDEFAKLNHQSFHYPGGQPYFEEAIISAAAKTDFNGTLNWYLESAKKDRFMTQMMGSFFAEELARNPVSFLKKIDSHQQLDQFTPVFEKLTSHADFSSRWQEISSWLDTQPAGSGQQALSEKLASTLASKNPPAAIQFVDRLTDSAQRSSLREEVALKLIQNPSLEEVENYSLEHPEWSQAFTLAAFKRLSEKNSLGPLLMIPWITASEELDNEQFKQVAPRLTSALFHEDPNHTIQWIEGIPEERWSQQDREQAIRSVLYNWGQESQGEVFTWLSEEGDNPYYHLGVNEAISILNRNEAPLAESWPWFESLTEEKHRKSAFFHLTWLSENLHGQLDEIGERVSSLPIPEKEKKGYFNTLKKIKSR